MGELTQRIIAELRSESSPDASDYIGYAGLPLEKVRSTGTYRSGFADIDAEEPSLEEGQELKQALFRALQRERNPSRIPGLIFALGKSGDPTFRDVYASHLRSAVEMLLDGNSSVFQALLALDALGEDVLERDAHGGTSQSLADIEKNARQARAFLAKHGINVPW